MIPTRAAASAHWVFRCSVGATTVTRCTVRVSRSSAATRSANVVFPAPGVATARKSLEAAAWYASNAAACHARRFPAVPHAARAGEAGERVWAAAAEGVGGPLALEQRSGWQAHPESGHVSARTQ